MKILIPFFLLPLSLCAQNTRWYANAGATGQNTGLSWTDAFTNLHDALVAAKDGDEVWVAQGVYRPSETGNRKLRFEPASGVRLFGGFAGGENAVSQRPPDGRSVLDGDIGVPGDSTDNSFNLMYLYHPDSTTLIDGFVLRNALANESGAANGQPGVSGAAVYIDGANSIAYPLFRNCIFENNTAQRDGAAVYTHGIGTGSVAPGFVECLFQHNRCVNGNGGAVYKNGASWWDRTLDFHNCTFLSNTATIGGAIYVREAERTDTMTIQGGRFYQNRATAIGSVLFYPIVRTTSYTVIRLLETTIEENPSGGYISINNSFVPGEIDIQFSKCQFRNISLFQQSL